MTIGKRPDVYIGFLAGATCALLAVELAVDSLPGWFGIVRAAIGLAFAVSVVVYKLKSFTRREVANV